MGQQIQIKGLPHPIEFDDGLSDEQIDHIVNTEILPHRQEIMDEWTANDLHKVRQEQFGKLSPLERFVGGLGRGLMDVYEGLGQTGLEVGNKLHLVDEKTLTNYEDKVDANRAVWDDASSGFASGSGRFTGNVVPFFAAPNPATAETVGSSTGAAAVNGFLQGGLQGLLKYKKGDESRLVNTGEGAVLGAAGGTAGELALKGLLPKIINAFKGNIKPAAGEITDLAKKFDVPVTAGDATNNPLLKRTEQGLEYIPGSGMVNYRKGQAESVKEAIKGVVTKYKDQLPQVDFEQLPKVQAAAAAGDRDAINIMNDVAKSANDPDAVIKVSAAMKLFRAKKIAGHYYDQVEQLAGDTKVPLTNLKSSLKSLDKANKDALLSEPEVSSMVKEIKQKVDPPFKMKNGVPQPTPVKEFTYGQLRKARSDIKDKVTSLQAQGKFKEASALRTLQDGVEGDLASFSSVKTPPSNVNLPPGMSPPQTLADAQKTADDFYRTKYGPMRDFTRKFFKNKEPDQLTQKGINPRSSDASQKFYSSLDDKGRAAVRFNIVNDAYDKAFDADMNTINPVKFAAHIDKIQNSTGFFFKGQDKQELDGLVKLLKHLDRAGSYANNSNPVSRIGQIGVLGGIAGGAAMNLPLMLKAYGGSLFLKQLLTSKVGKNLLLATSSLGPNKTKALDLLVSKIPAIMAGTNPLASTPMTPAAPPSYGNQ